VAPVVISKYLKLEPEGEAFRVQTLGSQLPGKKIKRESVNFFITSASKN
jgi:hypothetical protein